MITGKTTRAPWSKVPGVIQSGTLDLRMNTGPMLFWNVCIPALLHGLRTMQH